MPAEDHDLHADLLSAYAQIKHLCKVVDYQAELLSALLDRRKEDRRNQPAGLGAVPGIDRRKRDRRGRE